MADSHVHPQPADRNHIMMTALGAHEDGASFTSIIDEVIGMARQNLYSITDVKDAGSEAAELLSRYDADARLDMRTILVDTAVAHLAGDEDPLTIAIDVYLVEENSAGYGTVPGVPAITRRQVEDMLSR